MNESTLWEAAKALAVEVGIPLSAAVQYLRDSSQQISESDAASLLSGSMSDNPMGELYNASSAAALGGSGLVSLVAEGLRSAGFYDQPSVMEGVPATRPELEDIPYTWEWNMRQVGADPYAGESILGGMLDPSSAADLAVLTAFRGPRAVSKIGAFDPRFDPRVKERGRIQNTERVTEGHGYDAPAISIDQLEGHPFVLGMADRTDYGRNLVEVEGVPLKFEVPMQGGQGHMFSGDLWASAPAASRRLHNAAQRRAKATGKEPLFIPFRMAPTGSDFSTMVGETMISYAASNMPPKTLKRFSKAINEVIPDFKDAGSVSGLEAFRNASPDQRKKALQIMDRDFRNDGGISIGQARLAVTEPMQINAPDYYTQNVGRFLTGEDLRPSDHYTYQTAIPGEGIGQFAEPFPVLDLVPGYARDIGVTDTRNLTPTQAYTLRQSTVTGVIDEPIIRRILEGK